MLVTLGVAMIVFMGIFIAKDRFNFLAYSSTPLLSAIEENKIDSITLNDGKQTVELINKNGQWYQKNEESFLLADQNRVQSLFQNIDNLKNDAVTAENKNDLANYDIGRQRITLSTPTITFQLYIGNSTSLDRNYVKIDSQNEIFLADGFDDIFSPLDYRNLSLGLVNDESMVTAVRIQADGNTTNLNYADSDWLAGDKKTIKDRVSFYINDIKTLKAQDILINPQLPTNPDLTISITEKGTAKNADCFDMGNFYIVKVEGDNTYFKFNKDDIGALKKTAADFLN